MSRSGADIASAISAISSGTFYQILLGLSRDLTAAVFEVVQSNVYGAVDDRVWVDVQRHVMETTEKAGLSP